MLVAVATGATVMSSHKTPQIFSRRSEERPVGTFAQHRKQGPQGVLHIPGKPRSAPGAAADALGTAYCNAAGSIVAEASGITTEASEKKFRPQRTGRCGRNGVRKEWIVLFDLHQNGVGSHGLPLTDQNLLDRTGEIARDGCF